MSYWGLTPPFSLLLEGNMWPLKRTSKDKLTQQREIIRRLCQMASPYTPDLALLQEQHRVLVFVHDDMMQGKHNADLIVETSVTGRYPLAHCYTEDNFYFW